MQQKIVTTPVLMDCCKIIGALEGKPNALAFKARDPKMELARADALLDAFFSCLHLTERLCKVCRCVPT